RSGAIHGHAEKSRGLKANRLRDITCPRRRRGASSPADTMVERNGRLAGRPISKSRTRGTLSSAATVRYTLLAKRVSHACSEALIGEKKREPTANATGEIAGLRGKKGLGVTR
ncbi:hypothetical protein X777_05430, partial [Ooceraea biroi]